MLENLINVDRFNITFARYLLLYAVYGYFLRLSLWVDVIYFCLRFGGCNLVLEFSRISRGTSIPRISRTSRKSTPHQSKKKNKVGVAQNQQLRNLDSRANLPSRAVVRCVADVA